MRQNFDELKKDKLNDADTYGGTVIYFKRKSSCQNKSRFLPSQE